jgi:hypothetical protein
MSGMFGEKWNRPYGEWEDSNPTINIWGAALRGLTMEQVLDGLDAVANSGATFVPTAPEFKEICLGPKEHWEHARLEASTREHNENMKRLTHNKINKEVGRDHLKKWREQWTKN